MTRLTLAVRYAFASLPVAVVICLAIAAPALAKDCVADHREVKYRGGSAKLRHYACKIGTGAEQQRIRVTFHRLSEPMAGNLVMGEPLPELDAIVGRPTVVKNEVFSELDALFRSFGRKVRQEGEHEDIRPFWSVRVDTPPVSGTGGERASAATQATQTVHYITPPNPSVSSDEYYMSEPNDVIFKTDRWPDGFNHFYECEPGEVGYVSCTTIWRYIDLAALDGIERETANWHSEVDQSLAAEREKFEQETAGPNDPDALEPEVPAPEREEGEFFDPDFKRQFALFRHLGKRGWPADFMSISGNNRSCGSSYSFRVYPRPLVVDVVVVENASTRPLTIDRFHGMRSTSDETRAISQSSALRDQTAAPLDLAGVSIPAGEKIALPLRIVLADGTGQKTGADMGEGATWGDIETAKEFYNDLRRVSTEVLSEKIFVGDNDDDTITVKKRRKDFLPPTLPKVSEYVWGPELFVTGLSIGGKSVEFGGRSANFSDLTTAGPEASCPYLYAWNDESRTWTSHGKVLEAARNPQRKQTEVIQVAPSSLRFMLREEEPEVAYIDAVELRVSLRSGRRLILKPKQTTLAARDGRYLQIRAYRSEVIDFELPSEERIEDVVRSEFAVTGYYRRYSTIMSEIKRSGGSATP